MLINITYLSYFLAIGFYITPENRNYMGAKAGMSILKTPESEKELKENFPKIENECLEE